MDSGDPIERGRALMLIDSAVEQHLALARTIQFSVARSQVEKDAIYHLRFKVVLAQGWAQPGDFPDEREFDSFDDDATHILGRAGSVLAATSRIVFPRAARRLPPEEAFDMKLEPEGRVAVWDRTLVAPDYRGANHLVFWGLLTACWQETRRQGYAEVCGILSRQMQKLYRSMRVEFDVIGPGRTYWSEERFPCKLNILASASGIAHSLSLLQVE